MSQSLPLLSPAAAENLQLWRGDPLFADYRAAVEAAVAAGDREALEDCFGRVIPFGTAGRRGPEGVGPGRINARTIAESAAGLAADVLAQGAPRSAVVGFDTRRHSGEYAALCARVLAGAGLRVWLFAEPCATPQLAFEVHRRGAGCGVMLTASHNPPTDNGFKAYGTNGGQVYPPQDRRIIEQVMSLARQPLPCAELASPAIERVGRDDDEAYLDYVAGQAVSGARDVRLVFSPLHGVGARTVPPVLARAGFGDIHRVEAQCVADPAFGSLPGGIANPEQPAALAALIARCRELDADAGLAADPDADRLGFVARDPAAPDGYRVFNGNELATLIVWHTLESLSRQGRLAPNALVMRSVVGSDRIAALCADAGVELWGDLPIGFKWVGGLLAAGVGDDRLLAAVDESHGYNRGALVRDKDAASAALALAELAADCRARGMLVGDVLAGIEARHGLFDERVVSQPLARLADGERVLDALRRRPPRELLGRRVTRLVDRQATPWVNPATGLPHPESFLLLWLEGARLGVRVSGTEPKLKIYVLAHAPHGSDRGALADLAAGLPAALLCNAGGA